MSASTRPVYPAPELPEDTAEQKLLGLYPQRQPGLMLQRVRLTGGRLSAAALRAIADAAASVGARGSLHVTTRQDIEVHGIVPAKVPELQAMLVDAGLTTVGSAGDTVRNSTVDPLGGIVPGSTDLMPLAVAIEEALQVLDGVWTLPRKFKMSFSGDPSARMRPWMSDVGVIANGDGSFTTVVAGSLGARPAAGIEFPDRFDAGDVAALAVAAVRLHHREGDRSDRRKARLRHVRERMGDDLFLDELRTLFDEERTSARVVVPPLPAPAESGGGIPALRLALPHGDLSLAAARRLACAVDDAGGEVRLGIEHDAFVFGLAIDELPVETRAWVAPRRIVACPGTALCSKAAGPTRQAAEALRPIADAHPELLFALSGCPNSCSHAAAAGVGIVARMGRIGDDRRPLFRVTAGGEAGSGPRLGEAVAHDVPLEDLAATVEKALKRRS